MTREERDAGRRAVDLYDALSVVVRDCERWPDPDQVAAAGEPDGVTRVRLGLPGGAWEVEVDGRAAPGLAAHLVRAVTAAIAEVAAAAAVQREAL